MKQTLEGLILRAWMEVQYLTEENEYSYLTLGVNPLVASDLQIGDILLLKTNEIQEKWKYFIGDTSRKMFMFFLEQREYTACKMEIIGKIYHFGNQIELQIGAIFLK